MIAVVDAGPLYAAIDSSDDYHLSSISALESTDLHLIIPTLVITEVTYIVNSRLGPKVEAEFLRGLSGFDIEQPSANDWPRIADLVNEYADFPLGGVDASVVAIAERLQANTLITLDKQHFSVIKPKHCKAFSLLP